MQPSRYNVRLSPFFFLVWQKLSSILAGLSRNLIGSSRHTAVRLRPPCGQKEACDWQKFSSNIVPEFQNKKRTRPLFCLLPEVTPATAAWRGTRFRFIHEVLQTRRTIQTVLKVLLKNLLLLPPPFHSFTVCRHGHPGLPGAAVCR